MALLYDPPSGWQYGFPKLYKPLEGEELKDTLIRDGYPEKEAEFGSQYCRFVGASDKVIAAQEDTDVTNPSR